MTDPYSGPGQWVLQYRAGTSGTWTNACPPTSTHTGSTYSCSWNTTTLPDGSYQLRARRADQVTVANGGPNITDATQPAEDTVTIDNTAPADPDVTGFLVDADGTVFPGIDYDFTVDAGDATSGVTISAARDGATPIAADATTCTGTSTACSSDFTFNPAGLSGNHSVVVTITDGAGNTTPRTVAFYVDDTDASPLQGRDEIGEDPETSTQAEEDAVDTPVPDPVCDPDTDSECTSDQDENDLEAAVSDEPSLSSGERSAALVGNLETSLASTDTCFSTAGTGDDLDRGACGYGISDQKPSTFTSGAADLDDLSIHRVRLAVPWDVVPRGRGWFSNRTTDKYPKAFHYRSGSGYTFDDDLELDADPGTLATVTEWIQKALPCNSPIKYEVLISFEHSNGTAYSRQQMTMPTKTEYETATRAFLNLFDNQRCKGSRRIKLFSAWNEPNYDKQPMYGHAQAHRAGEFWNILNRVCHTTYSCAVTAGELLEYDSSSLRATVADYKDGMKGKASSWSLHPYRSSHLALSEAHTRISRYLSYINAGAKLWLTEQGGRYHQPSPLTSTPLDDECRLMRYREFSTRITRFYQYQLLGPPEGNDTFDTALIGARLPDDGRRDQYYIYKFFSAGTGSGYGDRCPSSIRNASL